jgi:hypothetical protein
MDLRPVPPLRAATRVLRQARPPLLEAAQFLEIVLKKTASYTALVSIIPNNGQPAPVVVNVRFGPKSSHRPHAKLPGTPTGFSAFSTDGAPPRRAVLGVAPELSWRT